jgi:hypothetical protein
VVRGTVDAMSIDTIEGKALTQERFLQALKDELSDQGDDDMPLKRKGRVSRKSEVEETEESGAKTKGWGKKASDDDEDEEEEDGEEEQKPRRRRSRARQADSVKSRLEGEDDEDEEEDEDDEEEEEKPRRRRGFSKSVKDRLEEEDGEDEEEEDGEDEEDEEPEEAPKPKRTRRSRAKPKADPEPEEDEGEDDGEEEDEPPFEGGQPVGCVPSPEEEAFYRRVRALELSAQFAERLSLKTASEAVKAAEVFYDYLTGSKK